MSAEGVASSTRGASSSQASLAVMPQRLTWDAAPCWHPQPLRTPTPLRGAPVSLQPVMAGRPPQVDVMPLFSPLTLRNSAMLEKYFWLASATFFSAACGFTISRPWAGEGPGAGWGGVRVEGEETGFQRNETAMQGCQALRGTRVTEGRGGREEKEGSLGAVRPSVK